MKFSVILVASTLFLSSTTALAAGNDTTTASVVDDTGIKSYSYPSNKKTSNGKMQIPPPPIETTPGHAAPISREKTRPETVKTAIDATNTTVGTATYVSKDDKVQRFATYLELKPGMENAPLTLHLKNQGFRWFRLLIANQVIATEKSLGSSSERDLDLTGAIQAGTNQVVVQAGGVPGSQLVWKVTTPAVAHIDKLDPNDEVMVGSELKISGKNFSTKSGQDQVYFNKKSAQASKASADELTVSVPEDAEVGDNQVSVKVHGVESNKVKIVVRGIPQISGTNLQGVRPGDHVMIFGKNFSKNAGENQVYFDETPVTVASATDTQLEVIVPFMPQHIGHRPSDIRVQVGKIMSENTVPIQVGPQMYADPGMQLDNGQLPFFSPRNLPRSNEGY